MVDLLFAGDVILPNLPNGDAVDEAVKDIIRQYDHKICNFEAPIPAGEKPSSKAGPIKTQNPGTAEYIKKLGFDTVTLANNHIMDHGKAGFLKTVENLEENGIAFFGAGMSEADAYQPYVVSKDGVNVVLINAAESSFGTFNPYTKCGHAWLFDPKIRENIIDFKHRGFYVILVAHAGAERVDAPLPEWREIYRTFIDLGVDAVVAHHPHVLQGYEAYKNGVIFYSLGNFLWQEDASGLDDYTTAMVGLSFSEKGVDYTFYPLVVKDGRMILDGNEKIDACQQKLAMPDAEYNKWADEYCEALFKRKYRRFVFASVGLLNPVGFKQYLINLFRILFKRNGIEEKYVFHNCAVETNAMIFKRATLRKLNGKD